MINQIYPLFKQSSKQLFKSTRYNLASQHYKFKREAIKKESISQSGDQRTQEGEYLLPHAVWTKEEVESVEVTHRQPANFGDRFAHYFIQTLRLNFDYISGYKKIFPWQDKKLKERDFVNRIIFLETVAGVPGFVGAMHRHLKALRNMQRDYGWIHTLLEEAENERMHLLTFLKLRRPSPLFRVGVVMTQVAYVSLWSIMYFFFPRVCHRIVGYLEEEAVKTYTTIIEAIKQPDTAISHWKDATAPEIAVRYWNLGPDAKIVDLIYAVRKDEEHHRDVNHELADDYTQSKPNPFPPGY